MEKEGEKLSLNSQTNTILAAMDCKSRYSTSNSRRFAVSAKSHWHVSQAWNAPSSPRLHRPQRFMLVSPQTATLRAVYPLALAGFKKK
eukprot:3932083-Rhodomonas_salina.2